MSAARPTVVAKPEEQEQPWQWSEQRWRGIGVRIEDDVLVTRDGRRNLSAARDRRCGPNELT